MSFFHNYELLLYTATQLWIAFSFFVLSYRLNSQKFSKSATLSVRNSNLLEAPLRSTALSYAVRPMIMFVLLETHESILGDMGEHTHLIESRPWWVGLLVIAWIFVDIWNAQAAHQAKKHIALNV